jgi:hypothetical protein
MTWMGRKPLLPEVREQRLRLWRKKANRTRKLRYARIPCYSSHLIKEWLLFLDSQQQDKPRGKRGYSNVAAGIIESSFRQWITQEKNLKEFRKRLDSVNHGEQLIAAIKEYIPRHDAP